MVIKAKSPKRIVSIIVPPSDLATFWRKLEDIQQASIFKELLDERKKSKNKKNPSAESKPVKQTRILNERSGKPKNRQQRRKDLRKATRKVIKDKVKQEKLDL